MNATTLLTNTWEATCALIQSARLCNFHRHIAGSLSPDFLAAQYRENPTASSAFLDRYGLDPTEPENIGWVISTSLARVEEGWKYFEEAFNPARFLLDNDPELKVHRRSFQQAVTASFAQSIHVVGVRATLGCHWRTPVEFRNLLNVAVQGILDAEKQSSGDGKGVLILSIRKDIPAAVAAQALRHFLDVRLEWKETNPGLVEKLYGVDSIGPEGAYDPVFNLPLFARALQEGLKLFHHLGETWEDGTLLDKLQQIDRLLASLEISYLTNPVALLVDYETLTPALYSRTEVCKLQALRERILARMRDREIVLEISPTSNEVLTRKKRQCEGWQFLPLSDIMRAGVRISVTDDDGEIFGTSLLEEYRKLYFGTTPYGKLSLEEIQELIGTGQLVRDV